MSEDNKDQTQDQKPAKTKESLLNQISGESDKVRYQETKKAIQAKLQQRREHEKAIKVLDTEVDEIWDKYQKGF